MRRSFGLIFAPLAGAAALAACSPSERNCADDRRDDARCESRGSVGIYHGGASKGAAGAQEAAARGGFGESASNAAGNEGGHSGS